MVRNAGPSGNDPFLRLKGPLMLNTNTMIIVYCVVCFMYVGVIVTVHCGLHVINNALTIVNALTMH